MQSKDNLGRGMNRQTVISPLSMAFQEYCTVASSIRHTIDADHYFAKGGNHLPKTLIGIIKSAQNYYKWLKKLRLP